LRRKAQQGIAMLEALLAIVILAIGVIGTIGLQARSVSALADAGLRAEAAIAADKLLGVMNTDFANLNGYKVTAGAVPPARLAAWHTETLRLIPGATIAVDVTPAAAAAAPAKVDITIKWRRKTDTPENTHRIISYLAGAQ
jgi:type IV pilus assembly protein PilV